MYSNKALLLLTLATSASAAVNYMAIPQIRDLLPKPTPVANNNLARDANDDAKCASQALDLLQSIPTPPPAVLSDFAKHPQQTDPCKFSIPASLSDDYSSYSSEVLSWFTGHEAELTSLAAQCSAAQSYTNLVNVCTDGVSSGSAASKPTGSNTAGSNTAGSTTVGAGAATSTNVGAAHETGMAFAALAAAGIAAIL
ncbi:hypothetical protein J3F83DRAFT_718071 [Trichoderma novae-zelandiae]